MEVFVMVQVYIPGNENFSQNGDHVLFCERCDLAAELNGVWSLDLAIPLDTDGRWKYVTENAVLKVPTWQDDEQLYRIEKVTKTEDGVSAIAYPIFYDSAKDCFLLDCRPTGKNGQQALDIMTAGTPYSGSSDIMAANTAYFVRKNLLAAIAGNESPTFLERWGGEILYDNYTVIINQRVGGDYGAEARYGLNIMGSEYTVDISELCTRIVPVAFNGRMLEGAEPWVDSPKISLYPNICTREVRYEHIKLATDLQGEPQASDIICETQTQLEAALIEAAEADFEAGCDSPIVTMDIDMVAIRDQRLKQTEPIFDTEDAEILDTLDDELFTVFYQSYKTLEDIHLGDTVHCRHYKLDITSVSRVVGLTWDCLRKCVTHITLGQFKQDYVSIVNDAVTRINSVVNTDGTLIAEKIRGFLDGSETQFRAQYNLAERSDVLAILFENLDSASPMYGALGIGTQGIMVSKTRTQDGRAWDWTTGITANGINADIGVFGILADNVGRNYINLDTGAVHLGDSTNYLTYDPDTGSLDIRVSSFSLQGSTIAQIADTSASAAETRAKNYAGVVGASTLSSANSYTDAFDASLNQSEVFNRLTNNLQNQGIYLDNGNLYVNASAINAGTLSADRLAAGSIDATKLNVSSLSALSADLGEITSGSLNIGNGAFVVTSAGALTATSGTFGGTISAGTYLGLPNTGMQVTSGGGLSGGGLNIGTTGISASGTGSGFNLTNSGVMTATGGYYTGAVQNGSTVGGLNVNTSGVYYGDMSLGTSGLSMGSSFSLGTTGTGKISNIVVDTNAIYSTGHTWYGSGTRGFYLGSDGSFGVGDNSNYMHFDASNGRLDIKVTSFALTSGKTIDDIAQDKADSALSSARTYAAGVGSSTLSSANSYTDTAIQNIPAHSYTQQQIYNMLVNNVPANQGIYLENGMLKINADAIAVGTMAVARLGALQLSAISADLGTITAGSISIGSGNRICTIGSDGTFSAKGGSVDGTITARDGYFHGRFQVGELLDAGDVYGGKALFYCNIECYDIDAGDIVCDTLKVGSSNVSLDGHTHTSFSGLTSCHFSRPWTIEGMGTSSTHAAMFNISGSQATICYGSASSIRYKDVIRDLTAEDVEKAYNIQPVIAKYKDGYLVDGDERVGMAYPMLVAEDVEKYLPTVATHRNGLTENWDERAMIPVMFQMIKELKRELEVLKSGKV